MGLSRLSNYWSLGPRDRVHGDFTEFSCHAWAPGLNSSSLSICLQAALTSSSSCPRKWHLPCGGPSSSCAPPCCPKDIYTRGCR